MLAPEVIKSAEKRVGQTICGKWHLDRVIGVGGMAAVYEATHRNRNQVAIKLLHAPLSLEEGTRQRFLREGYVANTIRHSGAVQILDDDVTDDGIAFLVMELLRGESVEERMVRRGGALHPHEALRIADQLLDVLGAAHEQHVVHRDIKPDNIFLTEEGRLKVLDFGIARLHQGDSGATKVGSFMGTPAFCAPEQARGRWDEVDLRTDLFSVGATLFTCLTGAHVHEAETSSEQLALAISASARSLEDELPGFPVELVRLVDKALAYDKADRFQSAQEMRAAVNQVMEAIPSHSLAPPSPSARRAAPSGQTLSTLPPPSADPDSIRPPMLGRLRARWMLGFAATVGALALFALVFRAKSPQRRASEADQPPAASAKMQESPPPVQSSQADAEGVTSGGFLDSVTTTSQLLGSGSASDSSGKSGPEVERPVRLDNSSQLPTAAQKVRPAAPSPAPPTSANASDRPEVPSVPESTESADLDLQQPVLGDDLPPSATDEDDIYGSRY